MTPNTILPILRSFRHQILEEIAYSLQSFADFLSCVASQSGLRSWDAYRCISPKVRGSGAGGSHQQALKNVSYSHSVNAAPPPFLFDIRGIPLCLERVVLETLNALRDAALGLGKAHVIALYHWDGCSRSCAPGAAPECPKRALPRKGRARTENRAALKRCCVLARTET